ncbi:MAG: diguanylate cyclase [Gammaproteobacteria bacterium]|nr:diguanylate cyclase [Gammaproteobacteria bacterium]
MLKPATPANERQRLKTLRDLKLLDTPPEERFDRVTRLAKQVFSTEIALVSLVDADRQWFKSRQGLDAEETPRDISFCGHAILDDKIMVVNDATSDDRFCDNPLVCGDPSIRFYAGYPLAAPDGSRVGTLCIIDNKPRNISKDQLKSLRELGRMVEEEFIAADDSTIDPVTGISNRNGFLAIADHLLAMCKRCNQPATLMVFHLQNLQEIEETSGGAAGDAAATEFAHMLMANFRDSDIVARACMDIFCVLLAGADLDGVETAQTRLEDQLNARNRDSDSRSYDLDIIAHPVAFKAGRHADAEALLHDGEVRIVDDLKEQSEEAVANSG